jgi:hypothetical protein
MAEKALIGPDNFRRRSSRAQTPFLPALYLLVICAFEQPDLSKTAFDFRKCLCTEALKIAAVEGHITCIYIS